MKKLLFLIFLFYSLIGFSEPITMEYAKQTAISFLEKNNSSVLKSNTTFTLTDAGNLFPKNTDNVLKNDDESRTMFLFNIGDSAGFIIVSGDNAVQPILGYSNDGKIDIATIPPSVKAWLEGYNDQIVYAQKNAIFQNEQIAKMWNGTSSTLKASGSVAPLVKTKWDQYPYFNELCPYDYDEEEYTITGCPATAMAQIMKYWEWPTVGSGYHSYKHEKYGTLSASFSSTEYDWDAMPDEVNSSNYAVALLMYHCGVAVDMNYGLAKDGGSGSHMIKRSKKDNTACEYAYPTYFRYDSGIKGVYKSDYTDRDWKTLLKEELDNGRPVQYRGSDKEGGHTWVCDGYDENDYFHMNWGWGGYCDGYYALNSLVPGTGGAGAGNGSYNSGQGMLIGIQPAKTESFNLILFDDVTASSSQITYGSSFSVSVNLKNKSDYHFYGDYAAAIFDANNTFIDMVEIKEDRSLRADYSYSSNLVFSTNGMLSLYPGNYKIYICYRAKGGSWSIAGNNFWHNYDTYASLKVKPYESDLRLYKPLSVVSEHIYSGDEFVVNTDVANWSDYDFEGTFLLALMDKEDIKKTYLVNYIEDDLPSNYCFGGSGLTFSTDSLEAPPGTYYLLLAYYWNNEDGDIIGSTNEYMNPIEIIVQEKPLEPDKYEENNFIRTAYTFKSLQFNNNTVSINTQSANIQNGSDIDYYKITLDGDYLYSISGVLNDLYSEENSKYTGDMIVSYSFDGEIWSDVYDNEIDKFYHNGSGDVYFVVSSYFSGGHGTYNLELNIIRSEMIQPDQYEPNNELESPYIISNMTFNDDYSEINLSANIHSDSDLDLFKIEFQEGYTYYVSAIVDDIYSQDDSPYTSDVLFVYSTDGEHASDSYDTSMEDDYVTLEGKSDIYFLVAPYEGGTIGTYNLKIQIYRDTLLLPDIYEPNNKDSEPYVFDNIVFINDTARINTDGANVFENLYEHDYLDIYALILEEGYNYTISANMNDRENTEQYTSNAYYLYAIKGEEDNVYDETSPKPFTTIGGKTIYFAVSVIDEYSFGTYNLELTIARDTILSPDAYEPNNRETNAYKFRNIKYVNDKTSLYVDDANIQSTSDYDFFTFDLEDGYNYTVDIRIKDKNTGMMSLYTGDVKFQYSIDGRNNSTVYDEYLPAPITIEGGSQVAVGVYGTKGTYGLEISIKRVKTQSTSFDETGEHLAIYPNPCKSILYVETNKDVSGYKIVDLAGRILISSNKIEDFNMLNLEKLQPGHYTLFLFIDNKWIKQSFIKK